MEFYYNETDKDVLIISADGGLNSDNADKFVNELAALIDAGQTKIRYFAVLDSASNFFQLAYDERNTLWVLNKIWVE